MIITKNVQIRICFNNIKHFTDLKYENIKINDIIVVDVNHLSKFSRVLIECECSNCHTTKNIKYSDYLKSSVGGYYCKDCKSIKTKKTNLLKYGVENVFQLESSKIKTKETNLIKYGTEHHLQNKEIYEKVKSTNKERYGKEFLQQCDDFRLKKDNTSLLRYGNKTSLMNEEIKEKIKKTTILKYGSVNALDNVDIQKKSKQTRFSNILKKYDDLDIIKIENDIYTIKCDNKEEHFFEISSGLLYYRKNVYETICCTICNEINSKSISGYETELFNFIRENYEGDIKQSDRTTIKKELDIYLPELKIAFEFNGVYWHNELHKNKNYHKNKSDLCDDNGIQLIHIWEDDWVYKKDIIKSMILNRIHKTNSIFGRKTIIKEIDSKISKLFLNENHIQGNVNSSVKLGLFYNEELVSIMTFGKLRKNMNTKNVDGSYEMYRFCNKLNYSVIGGASKLFNYFIKNYDPISVISYADRSYSNGNLYNKLGFEFVSITEPNYHYVIDGIRYYRYLFRKDILVKQGYDINKSEHDIMLERKIYRIYNSGNYKFIYNKKRFSN